MAEIREQCTAVKEAMNALSKRYRETVIHNAQVHRQLLREYALAHGIDVRNPEWEAEAAAAREADADTGVKVRTANPKGRPKKDRPSGAELWAECKQEMEKVRRPMSPTKAAGIVGRRHKLSAGHVMKLTRPHRTP